MTIEDRELPIAPTGDPVKNARCQKYLLELFVNSPMIIYMKDALKRAGCPLFLNDIKCVPCSEDHLISGFYRPGKGLFLCEGTIYSSTHLQETLTHELLHAFDYCTKEIDLSNNCLHNICTEIRASSLSGECRFANEFRRGFFGIKGHHQVGVFCSFQECVKRRALKSVSMCDGCKGHDIEALFRKAFPVCFQDKSPFIEIPY